MNTNANIQDMLVDIKSVLEAAQTVIDDMQPGDRKQIKELAQVVGVAVGKAPKEILGFVNHFAHHTNVAYVTRGKKGGVIKGTKPAKVVKVKKAKKVVDDSTVSS